MADAPYLARGRRQLESCWSRFVISCGDAFFKASETFSEGAEIPAENMLSMRTTMNHEWTCIGDTTSPCSLISCA